MTIRQATCAKDSRVREKALPKPFGGQMTFKMPGLERFIGMIHDWEKVYIGKLEGRYFGTATRSLILDGKGEQEKNNFLCFVLERII